MVGVTRAQYVRRPATETTPEFDLAYVRRGPRAQTPVVVLPGGPGLAALLPYQGFRRRAARAGLDVIMIEHRGLGLSRTDVSGRPLPVSAMRVTEVLDDIAAVLHREGVTEAVIAGASYGSYLAAAFGARHPKRVRAMMLDSALLSADNIEPERARTRELFWNTDTPLAAAVRQLVESGTDDETVILDNVRAAYELGGAALAETVVRRRQRNPDDWAWRMLRTYAARSDHLVRVPYVYEFDRVGAIGMRELNYAPEPDGLPVDPALTYAPLASRFPPFDGEAYDLPAELAQFDWPLVLLSGINDIRTPPVVAERAANAAKHGTLVKIDNGHSALEAHPLAFIYTLRRLVRGEQDRLESEQARISALPRRGLVARLTESATRLLTRGH